MDKLNALTAHELIKKISAGEINPQDVIIPLGKRIREIEPKIKAYIRLEELGQPGTIEDSVSSGMLKGIPVSIKDNICTAGLNTECCSKVLSGFKPPYDATVIKKLKQAGAVIVKAKTNMDEFAFGSSTENSCFGHTHNPWGLDNVVGGSSGGSAAAIAADEAILALGSDTGGSIRQPASFCGVVGLKPTYGRVSRYGLIAFASSLDQIGPITKDVEDSALLMNVISGYDENDATSVDISVPDYKNALVNNVKELKIGIPKEYFIEGMDTEVRDIVQEAVNKLKSLGASCQTVSLPNSEYAVPVYYIIAAAEASSNLARFDGVQYGFRFDGSTTLPIDTERSRSADNREPTTENRLINMYKKTRGQGFGEEVKRRVLLGTFVLSHGYYDAYYLKALKVRTLIKQDFDKVFSEFDCIATPTSPSAAFRAGERMQDPLSMYLSDIYTISVNLAGIPAISIPCGFTKKGLPVGLQILAKPFNEEMLFRVAYTYERNTSWHTMKPKI